MSSQFPSVTFVKVDVDDAKDVAAAVGISAMPTFKAFFHGNQVAEVVGADEARLRRTVEGLSVR